MSRCGRGSLVSWLLTMLIAGAAFCGRDVRARDLGRSRSVGGLGGPTDWRDWLLEEDARPASSDTDPGPFVRRITPKSVFVAPSFSGCSEGYRQDGMGRCVKFVKVNQAAQLDFILQKLNSKFAPASNKNKDKDDTGPFHVNIPLGFGSARPKGDAHPVSAADQPAPTTTDRVTTTVSEENTTTDTATPTTTADDRPSPSLADGIVSVQSAPIPFHNESEHRPKQESTVKRQPDDVRPFVIVVADDNHTFRPQTNTTAEAIDYEEESVTEAVPKTTTVDFTTSNNPTVATTDSDESDDDKESTAPGLFEDPFSTQTTTPFYDTFYTTSSSESDGRPTAVSTDGETPGAPTQASAEPSRTDGEDFLKFDAPTTAASTPNDVLDDSDERTESPAEQEEATGGHGQYGERVPTPNIKDPVQDLPDPYSFPSSQRPSLAQEDVRPTTDCANAPSSETIDLGFGRVVNSRPADDGCPPGVTTPAYPVGTTAPRPYRIRFPADDIVSGPPFSYSGAGFSPQDGYKKTGYVRFPERPSVPASHRPVAHGYGTKVWADGEMLSSSSWFPFFQSPKHWDRYNTDTRHEYVPVSTVYRKQYHDYRPSSSSSSSSIVLPASWPSLDKRRGSWPRRDRTLSVPQ